MALTVATNTGALMAQSAASSVNKELELSMERLSTGKRINSASDDAAGVAIASRLSAEIKGTNQAIRNAMDGQAMLDTAEGAHVEVENILQRMRELAVQSATDSNSASDRANLQLEIDQLLTEVDRISESTTWAGQSLLNGPDNGKVDFSFQIGSGTKASDSIAVSINGTSSELLGIGSDGQAAGGRTTGHAGISYKDGLMTIEGAPAQGDAFTFTLNGTSVSATFSSIDQYANDAAGAAAQIKDAIDAAVATAPTKFAGVSVVDNKNGTLSITQDTKPLIDTFTDAAGAQTATIDQANGLITFAGTHAANDTPKFKLNGTDVTVTRSATDGYAMTNVGTAAALKAKIELTVGLENIVVKDHGDGSLSFTQLSSPIVEGAEVTLTTNPTMSVAYDDVSKIAVSGAFTAGQTISFDLFGKTVSFKTADADGYENTLAGVASQMSAAINNAGISGVTAVKTSGANSVTLTSDMVVTNAVTNKTTGTDYIVATIGDAATATVAISGTDVAVASATAAGYASGDSYSFEVAGHKLDLVIGTDGYLDTKAGVAQQMKDLVMGLGLEGVTATASTGTTAAITITRAMTGVANSGSTVVTNVSSLAENELGDPTYSGKVDVSTADAATNAITRVDAALQTLNAQRANLGAISNRFDSTVANLTNMSTNLQGGKGRIEDADFAAETTSLAKSQILQQASTAMLAQANASKQNVLSLLQG
jgi:flagellin